MKATLEFSLPEEREEFDCACRGGELRGQVQNFDNWLRDQIKHHDKPLQDVRDTLHKIVDVG